MSMFEDAKAILAGEAKARAELEKELARKCDWDDAEDVQLHRSEERMRERLALLEKLVPKRICVRCGSGPFPDSRSWVINKSKKVAVCRRCFSTPPARLVVLDFTKLFGDAEVRYPLDGRVLVRMRESMGLTQSKFAELAGWSRVYQHKLEGDCVHTVSSEVAEVIVQVLREMSSKDVNKDDL